MFGRKKKESRDRRALFLYLGAALTLILLAVVLQAGVRTPASIGGPEAAPDFARLVDGAVADSAPVELGDAVRPAYVKVFERQDQYGLALVAWNPVDQRYELLSELPVSSLDGRLSGQPELSWTAIGPGASEVVSLSVGVEGAPAEATAYVVRQADRLQPLPLLDSRGRARAAVFVTGQYGPAFYTYELKDIDGDEVPEAVAETRSLGSGTGRIGYETTVDVYAWRDGQFAYDKELSWAMTTSAALFPSPSP